MIATAQYLNSTGSTRDSTGTPREVQCQFDRRRPCEGQFMTAENLGGLLQVPSSTALCRWQWCSTSSTVFYGKKFVPSTLRATLRRVVLRAQRQPCAPCAPCVFYLARPFCARTLRAATCEPVYARGLPAVLFVRVDVVAGVFLLC